MKKLFTLILAFTLICSFVSPISATEKLSDEEIQRIQSLSNESMGKSEKQDEGFFGNFFKLFVSIEAPKLVAHGKTNCINPLFGDAYVLGISDSNIECDFISVKLKVYKPNGALLKTNEDSENNATYVGIDVENDGVFGFSSGYFAYGYHRFKKTSYNDINLETYDKF